MVERRSDAGIAVPAPHGWDGIGQALRCAYDNHRLPPEELTQLLTVLETVR